MQSYRIYWLDGRGRIKRGEWIEAADDADARRQARDLCDAGTFAMQVWQSARLVEEFECHPSNECR